MRRTVHLTLTGLLIAGCQPPVVELTEDMKAGIAAEVDATAAAWWDRWAAVDYDGGMAFFEDVPETTWVWDEGVLHTVAGMNAHWAGTWCAVKDGMRVFRVDRILEATEADGHFDVPGDFDPRDYLTPTRVYRAEGDVEVRVRYSPNIARWVREGAAAGRMGWEEESDGSVVIRHRVADPHWVVGHALDYGPEAEILEPEELRALVRDVLAGMRE